MSYNDLRKGRYSDCGMAYHITSVTRNRYPHFQDWQIGRIVVRQLMRLAREGVADTLCFVVMPDHVHWLMVLRQGSLAETVRRLKARASREFGQPLWQPNYHDHALRGDEDLRVLARYIVANPLRAGLVEHLGDYPLWDAIWLDGSELSG
ncbi:MAG: transposase [Rhodocyclaceae bacterium]|nr:transposase [Rhodocyclaceae bacterium]